MITAIYDFGAGHSGLDMLADFQPDVIKIDMALTRVIHSDPIRFEIGRAIIDLCTRLHISVVAEGIETLEEAVILRTANCCAGTRACEGLVVARSKSVAVISGRHARIESQRPLRKPVVRQSSVERARGI